MARHEIERVNRIDNPEQTVGLDMQKVRNTVATLSFRAGEKGKTIAVFEVEVWRVL